MKSPNPYHILGSALIEWFIILAISLITWAFVSHGIGCLADTSGIPLCLAYSIL